MHYAVHSYDVCERIKAIGTKFSPGLSLTQFIIMVLSKKPNLTLALVYCMDKLHLSLEKVLTEEYCYVNLDVDVQCQITSRRYTCKAYLCINIFNNTVKCCFCHKSIVFQLS